MRVIAPTIVALVALLVAGLVTGIDGHEPGGLTGTTPESTPPVAWPLEGIDLARLASVDGAAGSEQAGLALAMVEPPSFRPDELSPADQPAMVIADLLYDGLTEVDGSTGALRPALASTWAADESFTRWTFELDPAAGPTADDVVVALSPLVVEPGSPPETSQTGAALTAAMSSITAVQDHVVAIELVQPNAGLAWILSGLPYSVIGVDGTPTGAYRIEGSDESGLRLQRRAVGPRNVAGGSDGGPGTIEIRWSDDPAAAYRLLVDGEVDGAIVGPGSLADAERRFGATASPSTAARFYVLNPNAEELSARERRAALVGQIDQVALVGAAKRPDLAPLDGLVSPALAGYRPNGCGPECGELDDGAGSSAAGELAWSMDEPLQVTYAGAGQGAVADALSAQLEDAGIPARSTESTPRELASAIVEGSPALFGFGWVAPAGSVDAVVPPLLRLESPANVARFSSPGLEEILDEAALIEDDTARWALLERAHQLALAEARVLPVAVSTGTMIWSPEVSGAVQRPDGSIDLESWS